MKQVFLTRKDADVGVGMYDSIAWAFETHLKAADRPELQSAMMHCFNEDSPDQIDFYAQARPLWNDKPAFVWRADDAEVAQ